jgi:hypothetical protein
MFAHYIQLIKMQGERVKLVLRCLWLCLEPPPPIPYVFPTSLTQIQYNTTPKYKLLCFLSRVYPVICSRNPCDCVMAFRQEGKSVSVSTLPVVVIIFPLSQPSNVAYAQKWINEQTGSDFRFLPSSVTFVFDW